MSYIIIKDASAVSAPGSIADESVVRGDGGATNIQDSLLSIDDSGNLNLNAGALQDSSVVTPINLGNALNIAFNTTDKSVVGAVNENKAQIDLLKGIGSYTTKSDPVVDNISVSDVDDYIGVIITLTAAGNDQTLPAPTDTSRAHTFTVINNDTSSNPIDIIGSSTINLLAGEKIDFTWDGSAWIANEASGIWSDDGTDVRIQTSTRNISLQTGGLKDSFVTTPIKLGESGELSFSTTKKSIVGAVNEVSGAIPQAVEDTFVPTLGQTVFALSIAPISADAFALYLNGQLREQGVDYTQVGTVLTWLDPGGLTLLTTDKLIARYNNAGTGVPVKYCIISVETNSNEPNQRVRSVSASLSFNFTFGIPPDFVSLISLELRGICSAGAAGSGKDIDLSSNYYGLNEPINQHIETDTGTTYDFTGNTNQGISLDLSIVFSNLSAGDQCGVNVDHNSIGGNIQYTQIILGYT